MQKSSPLEWSTFFKRIASKGLDLRRYLQAKQYFKQKSSDFLIRHGLKDWIYY